MPFRKLLPVLALAVASCGGGGGSAGGGTDLPAVDTRTVSASDPGSALPPHWHTGVFMEIYVRGYKDSNGDGIGDLQGVTQSLDYLKTLGISGIWLMPITKSQDRDHGYAVTDYRDIEPQYGTLADFDELLREAHARGIGVVMDYVINHSAAQHPAFVNSKASTDNGFRDWFVWQAAKPGGWNIYGKDPWHATGNGAYFAAFWDQMPDFNLRNPAVLAWHHDSMRYWLNRGVDGFRFDAVGHLVENGPQAWDSQPENYTIMNGVRRLLDGYAQRYMVCEAPNASLGFADPSAGCGSAFAFGHNHDVVNAAKGVPSAVKLVSDYFRTAPGSIATMVSNHDSFAGERLHDQVGGNAAQYRLAAATYLLQPGTPFIYYGEEIGMSGGSGLSGDPKLRTPMSWTADASGFTSCTPFRALSANVSTHNVAAQQADANSLLNFYKGLIALRNATPSLARGSYEFAAAAGSVMSFQRGLGNERTVAVFNYGTAAATALLANLPANATLTQLWPASGAGTAVAADAGGNAGVTLGSQAVAVFRVQ
jgi:alpha-amylase